MAGHRGFVRRNIERLRRDERGGAAVMVALSLPVVVGFIALGVEVGEWYVIERRLQAAADAAAFAAAVEKFKNANYSPDDALDPQTVAGAVAAQNGFTGSVSYTENPPGFGAGSIRVTLSEPTQTLFANVLSDGSVDISASAVAEARVDGDYCLLSLSPSESQAISLQGNASVGGGCGMAVNSNHSQALYVGNSADTGGGPISVVGGASGFPPDNVATGQAPMRNPFASLPVFDFDDDGTADATPDCTHHITSNNTVTGSFDPSAFGGVIVFCIDHNRKLNLGDVTFGAGIYVIAGNELRINANADISGSNVLFIFTEVESASLSETFGYPDIWITGGSSIDLAGRTEGTYEGMLLFYDPGAPSSVDVHIGGNAGFDVSGSAYMPSVSVDWQGNATSSSDCMMLVANTIQVNGNGQFRNNDCADMGAPEIGRIVPVLVN